jgi:hypothetical protein
MAAENVVLPICPVNAHRKTSSSLSSETSLLSKILFGLGRVGINTRSKPDFVFGRKTDRQKGRKAKSTKSN